MNSIQAFLNPIPFEPIQAPVSQRYLDEAGNPILWEFRPISHKENEAINRRCMRRDSKGLQRGVGSGLDRLPRPL